MVLLFSWFGEIYFFYDDVFGFGVYLIVFY